MQQAEREMGSKRIAAYCARVTIAGVSIFVAIMYVAFVFIQPELDPLERFGSEYVAGRMGWLMQVAFFCLAAGLFAFAAAMTVGLDAKARSPAGILFALGALGILLAGIFETDLQVPSPVPPRRWMDPPHVSQHHVVHVAASIGAFLSILLGMAVATRRLRKAARLHAEFRWLRHLSWLAPLALIAFNVWLVPSGLAGLGQRVFLGLACGWLLLAARGFVKSAFVLEDPRP